MSEIMAVHSSMLSFLSPATPVSTLGFAAAGLVGTCVRVSGRGRKNQKCRMDFVGEHMPENRISLLL